MGSQSMKCDELKSFTAETFGDGKCEVYEAVEVDAAIAELKDEIKRKDGVCKRWFEKCMDARTENRKLKRALWLARAKEALDRARIFYFAATCGVLLNIDGYSNNEKGRQKLDTAMRWEKIWLKVVRKCRSKAEEYK